MITAEASLLIARPVAAVFAYADDFANAPRWLESCVVLKQTSPEARARGSALHYHHRQGGREGEMKGTVTVYEKDARLDLEFADPMFQVAIELQFAAEVDGTRVRLCITITPLTMMGKLMTPMIRAGNQQQVTSNLARLKQQLEAGA